MATILLDVGQLQAIARFASELIASDELIMLHVTEDGSIVAMRERTAGLFQVFNAERPDDDEPPAEDRIEAS